MYSQEIILNITGLFISLLFIITLFYLTKKLINPEVNDNKIILITLIITTILFLIGISGLTTSLIQNEHNTESTNTTVHNVAETEYNSQNLINNMEYPPNYKEYGD